VIRTRAPRTEPRPPSTRSRRGSPGRLLLPPAQGRAARPSAPWGGPAGPRSARSASTAGCCGAPGASRAPAAPAAGHQISTSSTVEVPLMQAYCTAPAARPTPRAGPPAHWPASRPSCRGRAPPGCSGGCRPAASSCGSARVQPCLLLLLLAARALSGVWNMAAPSGGRARKPLAPRGGAPPKRHCPSAAPPLASTIPLRPPPSPLRSTFCARCRVPPRRTRPG
jgi:hypothetical protein